jgi:hypothetical protein
VIPALARVGAYFQRFLEESGSGFFGKGGPSYVDFYVAESVFFVHTK